MQLVSKNYKRAKVLNNEQYYRIPDIFYRCVQALQCVSAFVHIGVVRGCTTYVHKGENSKILIDNLGAVRTLSVTCLRG